MAGRLGGTRRSSRELDVELAGTGRARAAPKKKSIHAAERDTERVTALRGAFLEAIQGEDVACFKFVDETGVHLTYPRRYGRAVGGRRVRQGVSLHGGPNVTVVGALSVKGLEAVMSLDGALNQDHFAAYLEQVLGPTLRPGDVVVLDKLRVHKVAGMRERIEACGARVLFLPPSWPAFSPIENGWSNFKTSLRTAQARTREALNEAICAALKWISADDAQNWFAHCGYHVQ
jgi:transposase